MAHEMSLGTPDTEQGPGMGREEAWTGRSEDLGSNPGLPDWAALSRLPKKGKNEGLGPQGLSLRGLPKPGVTALGQ